MSTILALALAAISLVGAEDDAAEASAAAARAFDAPVRARLLTVELRLRANTPADLSPSARARRAALLDELARYRARGVFPHNHDEVSAGLAPAGDIVRAVPVFIDEHGTACAVGHLMIASGARALAEDIARADVHVRVHDITDERALAWARDNGFTVDELAAIQPSYVGWIRPEEQERDVCDAARKPSKSAVLRKLSELNVRALPRKGDDAVPLRNRGRLIDTALRCAVEANRVDTVKALITGFGADPNGDELLGRAAAAGQLAMVKLLLEQGATPLWRRRPAIFLAKNKAVAKALLDGGASATDGVASAVVDPPRLELLLARGGDPNAIDPSRVGAPGGGKPATDEIWTSPYALTLSEDIPKAVRSLIQPSPILDVNRTALHRAAALGRADSVRILLAAGADANAKTEQEITPVHVAAHGGHLAVVKQLAAAGADACAISKSGLSALHFALLGARPSALALARFFVEESSCPVAGRDPAQLFHAVRARELPPVPMSAADAEVLARWLAEHPPAPAAAAAPPPSAAPPASAAPSSSAPPTPPSAPAPTASCGGCASGGAGAFAWIVAAPLAVRRHRRLILATTRTR